MAYIDDDMDEREILPFPEVLDILFKAEVLPIHLLHRLSDLSEGDLLHFNGRWPLVADERRQAIIRHLADLSEDNFVVDFVPIFTRCLQDTAAPVRIAALDGIWDSTNLSLIDPVVALMREDEIEEVRVAAASSLAHFVLLAEWGQLPRSVLPPLVQALLDELVRPDQPVPLQRAILEALGSSGDSRIPTLIEDAYESDDVGMRLSAVYAMGSNADTRWLPIILDEMSSDSAEMRMEAARAAGAIGDESAVSSLGDLTLDEELQVALAAVEALGQVGGERASRILLQIANDPELEELHESVDDALDALSWLDGSFDFLSLTDDESEEA